MCGQKLLCSFPDSPETVVLSVVYAHLFVSLGVFLVHCWKSNLCICTKELGGLVNE